MCTWNHSCSYFGVEAMALPEPPRLYLKNIRISASKWEIRSMLQEIGVHPGEIQCCKVDSQIQPRHQTVFVDMNSDAWLCIIEMFHSQKISHHFAKMILKSFLKKMICFLFWLACEGYKFPSQNAVFCQSFSIAVSTSEEEDLNWAIHSLHEFFHRGLCTSQLVEMNSGWFTCSHAFMFMHVCLFKWKDGYTSM